MSQTKKLIMFCFVVLSCIIQSCFNYEQEEETLTIELKNYGKTKSFFDSICLKQLEQSFIRYDIWPKSAILKEGCIIDFDYQRLNLTKISINEPVFLGFLYSVLDVEYIEIYIYDATFGDFTPIRLKNDSIVQDTTLLVRLYLNGGITCGDIDLKGSDSESFNKNGVFTKQN